MTTVFKQIGPYRILRQIGHGGMAVVFLATDTRCDRQVALKLVQQGSDRETREIVEAEQLGAELQQRFSERAAHVPAVYEHGLDEDSGYFYVAMEYLDGENLSEVIARGALPPAEAVEIAIALARFLEDAHGFQAVINGRNLQSLLHLDLKPRNVRITSTRQVKVLDFGTAKGLSLSRKVTRNDFGSVAYLSPERLQTGEVDARADLWALGVVLYEMLRGSPPFQASDTRRLERLILSRRPPPSLAEEHPEGGSRQKCPPGLQAIVARLLDPTAAQRYGSAREIREDLERFTAGQPTTAETGGWPANTYADEATRRTRVADDDDEKTRRTHVRAASPAAGPPAPAVVTPVRSARLMWLRRAFSSSRIPRAAILIIVLGIVLNELVIAVGSAGVASAVWRQEFEQLPASWTEYERLAGRSYLRFGTSALRRALIDRTEDLADRVIANYRTPTPTVREAQWATARDALARAVAATAGENDGLSASLRLCEGHLARINGEARKGRDELERARRDMADAVVAFRQAADLRRNWPDPYLGLMRIFAVGLDDVDLAADALSKAQERGYEPTERDFVQLADAYRVRGNSFVRSARQLAGLPQQRDHLTRAADAYREALGLYDKASNVGNVPINIGRTQRALVQVEESLATPSDDVATTPADSSAPMPALPFQGSASLQGGFP